ncbi:MAG: amidohydrolase family protein [Pseudomonadota bacterium]
MSESILITDALVVAQGTGSAPFLGWVAVRAGRIEAVDAGPPPDGGRFDRVIAANGGVLIPGLINAHAHSHSTLTRGSAEGLPLEEWLPVIIGEMRRLTDEQAYCAALVTYAEALLSGTTCLVDMCLRPAVAARAAAALGIRGGHRALCRRRDGDRPDPGAESRTDRALRRPPGRGPGLGRAARAVDLQRRAGPRGGGAARHHDVGIHTHCSETQAAEAATRERTGRSQVAHLDHLGCSGRRPCWPIASGWRTPTKRPLAARRRPCRALPAIQPEARVGHRAEFRNTRAQGINVALGTDGAKANNRLDQFDTMKFASLLPKGVACDATALPAGDVLDMATRHGAAALGLEAGRIAPGLRADLVLLHADRVHLQPVLPQTIVTNLVHAARGGDVDYRAGRRQGRGRWAVAWSRCRKAELARQARDAASALLAGA